MTLFVHALRGCAPAPLAHYLKALGVLRLVATQVDKEARGFWKHGEFFLATTLDEESLVEFFLERYEPTPMLSPWNGGSGFYPGDNKDGYGALRGSKAERFAPVREAILQGETLVAGLTARPAGDDKQLLLRRCVATWDATSHAWLRAAFSLDGAGEASYPALLGTGGNDGRLDFTNNNLQWIAKLFDVDAGSARPGAEGLLRLSLLGAPSFGLADAAIGQFFPGAAGGANATSGFDGGSQVNAWDFVLMLEGALVLRVASLRRLDSDELVQAAAPFALRAEASGYASASPADASARGEQWVPLWSGPSTLAEVSSLFDEGRLHGGHRAARGTLDATRALANLGVARGVDSFARFGYFERNGQSNLAVPLGLLAVKHRPEVRVLDELDRFVRGLAFAAEKKGAPLSLPRAARALQRAMLAASFPTATRETWAELLCVLGEVEQGFVSHRKSTKEANLRPLPRLSPRWLDLIDDGSVEVRLAIAIASQGHPELGPLRANVLPLAPPYYEAFRTTADSLADDPSVVWGGRSLVDDLTAVALRRTIDGTKKGTGALPLIGRRSASLEDIQIFLEGRVDDARVGRLVRGLLSLDWARVDERGVAASGDPVPLHALVRMGYLPHAVQPLKPRLDATPLRLLASGRLADGAALLIRRLAAGGLRVKLRVVAGDAAFARRLAASVAIPVSRFDSARLLARLSKPASQEARS